MKRAMVQQAEAERERRSRVIMADGESQASKKLAEAAGTMADTPAALQLRLLRTIVEVAAEKSSTVVLPFPVELLRFLENATGSIKATATGGGAETSDAGTAALDRDGVESDHAHEGTRAQLPSKSSPRDQDQAKAT